MRHEERFYRDLVDNLQDGVYFVDRDGRITYWNRAAERLTGYASDEVVGSRCSDGLLMHIDDNGVNLCLEGCPLARRGDTVDSLLKRADGLMYSSKAAGGNLVSLDPQEPAGSGPRATSSEP